MSDRTADSMSGTEYDRTPVETKAPVLCAKCGGHQTSTDGGDRPCPACKGSGIETKADYQSRVFAWAVDCFGEDDATLPRMRAWRFLEEALELFQATGAQEDEALRILKYVYNRPMGLIGQEIGGTMVALAVFCQAYGFNLNECAEAELTRVLGLVEHIRKRHAAKPDFGSPEKPAGEPR